MRAGHEADPRLLQECQGFTLAKICLQDLQWTAGQCLLWLEAVGGSQAIVGVVDTGTHVACHQLGAGERRRCTKPPVTVLCWFYLIEAMGTAQLQAHARAFKFAQLQAHRMGFCTNSYYAHLTPLLVVAAHSHHVW